MRFSVNEVLEYTLHFHWVLQVRRAVTSMAESGITTTTIIIISSSALEPLTPVVRAEVCPAPLETQSGEKALQPLARQEELGGEAPAA